MSLNQILVQTEPSGVAPLWSNLNVNSLTAASINSASIGTSIFLDPLFLGPWSSGPISLSVVCETIGTFTTIQIAGFQHTVGTTGTTSQIQALNVIPSGYQPATTIIFPVVVINNSAHAVGICVLSGDGSIVISSDISGDPFPPVTGVSGFYTISYSYIT
jgi:hypothetical protein